MNYKAIFCNNLCTLIVLISFFSCAEKEIIPKETNEFIQHFLDHNSERIYKSEIQRVKVNYFPASTMLVYSFWKEEKYRDNGKLFLHLYPSEVGNLIDQRRKYKFVNVPLNNMDHASIGDIFFYRFQNLQLPFDLSSLQTGQYNDTLKTWKSDYVNLGALRKVTDSKKSLLNGENIRHAAELYINRVLSPILGPKVYAFKDIEVEVYYNASLNRFTILSKEPIRSALKNKTIFIDYYNQSESKRRQIGPIGDLLLNKETNFITLDLPLDTHFDEIVIGQIENDKDIRLKVLENRKLIHASHPIKGMNAGKEIDDEQDHDIQVVNQLITNNLPLLYYSTEHKLRLFLNEAKKRAYIVSDNVDTLNDLGLMVRKEVNGQSNVNKVNLDNSFYLLGKTSQLAVYELNLANEADSIVLSLNLGKKEIYQRVFK